MNPVFTSRKLKDEIKIKENKPPLVSQQCVVYKFQCDLCDARYVGYTCQHLYQRIEEHKTSEIAKHIKGHGVSVKSKLECLIYEMLYIRELRPSLNKQCDSVRAKPFTQILLINSSFIVLYLLKDLSLFYCSNLF